MITQETVAQKIIAHLNGEITEKELIHWAEDAFVIFSESDADIANEKQVMDALMYIGAGNSPGFPLTWEVLSGYLEQLGTKVRVIAEAS
jgi:hypothetical protein